MIRRFFCASALALVLPIWSHAEENIQDSVVWRQGVDGYHTYRIPVVLVTAKGSVLAVCEGRKTSSKDHGDVDLIMKRSTDGGRSWAPQQVVHEEGGDAQVTIGNPCPVVDAATGTIWMPFTRDNKAVFITSSKDDGQTWSTPQNFSATAMKPGWDWVATGPGIGIQLGKGKKKGRLIIPSDHKKTLAGGKVETNSHMMFSDDAGKTWKVSSPIQAGGNECQVIERADGTLLVNTRMQGDFLGWRGTATSNDGGGTWTAITHEKLLPCPKCQASLIKDQDGSLLFSNPSSTPEGERADLTVRLSPDGGKNWLLSRLLHAGPSGYSCLGVLPDGTYLCIYEGGKKKYSESIRIARFTLDWLTQS